MSVVIVGSPSAKFLLWLNTRDFTLEKSHKSVVNVGNPLDHTAKCWTTIGFILEKSLVNVGSTLYH